ncbi:hypothetical protein BTH41_05095 [Bacillus mycoides]|nr:hypothetical protein BTH41_05095 [Bacillus mycoides]
MLLSPFFTNINNLIVTEVDKGEKNYMKIQSDFISFHNNVMMELTTIVYN